MRNLLILSLVLAGCSSPHNARTVAEFEQNHPWAKRVPAHSHVMADGSVLTYEDNIPRHDLTGSQNPEHWQVTYEHRLYVLQTAADGKTLVKPVAVGE